MGLVDLEEVYKPIRHELKKVEARLIGEVSAGSDLIAAISGYAFKSPGKRLRPALTLFSAKVAQAKVGQAVIDVAAVVELLHTATLIQDDVIDKASLRRGRQTVSAVFGGNISILFGDYLFSKSFSLLAKLHKSQLLHFLSRVTNSMAIGEMEQLFMAGKYVSEDRYFSIIRNKTATLFSACCEMGAKVGGVDAKKAGALAEFGLNFGLAYQIIDDCLDKDVPAIYRSARKAREKARQHIALGLDALEQVIPKPKRLPFIEISDYILSCG